MKMIKTRILCFMAVFYLACDSIFGQISTDTIFPDSTQAFIAVTSTARLEEQWNKTIYSEMLARPGFENFRTSLQKYTADNWTSRFGMKLTDVMHLASGEVGIGLIAAPGLQPGYAMVMDCNGKQDAVDEFLRRVIKDTTEKQNGEASKERFVVNNQAVEAMVLTIPPTKRVKRTSKIYYIQFPNMLIVADQRSLVELILQRLAGQLTTCIGTTEAYQKTLQRSISDRQTQDPILIKFFVRPLEAGEAARSFQDLTEQERAKPSTYSILAKQGFNGIKGIGGVCDLAAEDTEVVWRAMAYVPDPPELALKMLSFENIKAFSSPKWITSRADGETLLRVHVNDVFNNFGTLFDEFLETPDAWNDILVSLEKDENGAQVNVANDLIAWLEDDLSRATIFKKPLNEDPGRFVLAIPIKKDGAKKVENVLHRMFDTDPDFRLEAFGDSSIWIYAPKPKQEASSSSAGRSGSRTPYRSRNAQREAAADDKTAEPKGAFCVAFECLFISSDAFILKETVAKAAAASEKTFASSPEYRQIQAQIDKDTAETGRFMQGMHTNIDVTEANYNLYKQGKLPESQTYFARLMKAFSDPDQDPAKKFDGSTLPDFSVIRDDIAPSGYWGRVESNGWFFKGFTIKKQK